MITQVSVSQQSHVEHFGMCISRMCSANHCAKFGPQYSHGAATRQCTLRNWKCRRKTQVPTLQQHFRGHCSYVSALMVLACLCQEGLQELITMPVAWRRMRPPDHVNIGNTACWCRLKHQSIVEAGWHPRWRALLTCQSKAGR